MSLRESLSGWLSVVLKALLICAIAIGGVWFVMCIWGNIAEGRAKTIDASVLAMPSINKAGFEFVIGNTGQTVLTPKYETIGTAYHLQGYYELVGKRWLWRKAELVLDEKYFGEITVTKREN